jgi:hypothetical protein
MAACDGGACSFRRRTSIGTVVLCAAAPEATPLGSTMSSTFPEPSLVDITEVALVRRLLEDRHRRSHLLAIHGMPRRPLSKECVRLTDLPGSPQGDVDILLWTSGEPARAVAIEVKRFKATVGDPSETRLNKLREFEKGVRQANDLARIGFAQVYLWIFALVDSRRHPGSRTTSFAPSPRVSSTNCAPVRTARLKETTIATAG